MPESIPMNRAERRKWEQQFQTKGPTKPLINVGECFFCGEEMKIPEGTAVMYLNITGDRHPTHKACRKENPVRIHR